MRNLPVSLAVLGLSAALLTACQRDAGDAGANVAAEPVNAATPAEPANVAEPVAAKPFKVEEKGEFLEFSYGWPAQAAAIPALDQWLRGNMAHHRARMTALGRAGVEDARKNGWPEHPYDYVQTWEVAADTPALLVLHAQGYEYTGGAHGNPFPATLIWDKAKGARLATSALIDAAALAKATKARFCKALDAQRAEKRGAPVDSGANEPIPEFSRCVALEKQEIVPVSTSGKAIDLIRIEIMPYEAGPYSEGIYTIELPVDAATRSAVKPAWKGAFGPG
jgi:hypothetical protein